MRSRFAAVRDLDTAMSSRIMASVERQPASLDFLTSSHDLARPPDH